MVENLWNKAPIVDVVFAKTDSTFGSSNCPKGYDVGAKYFWDGTYSGCNCEMSSRFNGWQMGVCNSTQSADGCMSVNDVGPLKMSVYDKRTVCVKTDSSLNYFDMIRPELNRQVDAGTNEHMCPETDAKGNKLKLCGTGSELEYKMCIPEKSTCPITDIVYDLAT